MQACAAWLLPSAMLRFIAVSCLSCQLELRECQRYVALRNSILADSFDANTFDTAAVNLLGNLLSLPTLFEEDKGTDSLIQSAVRQNVKGTQVQPLTALEWCHLVILSAFPKASC